MSLRGWNLPQVLLSSLTCIQVIQEPSTAITTDKIGKSRMYTISTRVQGRPDSKNALWMDRRIIPTGLNELLAVRQGMEVSALLLNAWTRRRRETYTYIGDVVFRSARSVNVTNVNTTSCKSVVFHEENEWVSAKLGDGPEAEVGAERENFIVAATTVVEQSKYIQSSLH